MSVVRRRNALVMMAVAGAVLMAGACGGNEGGGADSDSATVPEAATVLTTPPIGRSPLAMAPGEFATYIRGAGLSFDDTKGHVRPRLCRGNGCPSGSSVRTNVAIAPETRAGGFDPTDIKEWYVIAKLSNQGPEEATFGIPAGAREVYWVIGPGVGSAAQSIFIHVRESTDSILPPRFGFADCGHNTVKPLEADLRACKDTTPLGPNLNPALDAPAWISCIPGCCQAEM